MQIDRVLDRLCWYDPRHPLYSETESLPRDNCSCDNCFYGKDALALEILAGRTRIAELVEGNMELRHFIERWSTCPNPHTEMADTGGHLDETPCGACSWCEMADEYDLLTTEGKGDE